MEDDKIKLLYVEDDLIDQMALKRTLAQNALNYDALFAASISEAGDVLRSHNFDIIITDFNLGDGNAFDLFELVDDTPIMVATGAGDEEIAVKVIKSGAYDYFVKDANRKYLTMLPVAVEQTVSRHRADRRFRLLSNALKNIKDMVSITDINGTVLFINQAFIEDFGYSEEEIIGQPLSMINGGKYSIQKIYELITENPSEGWQGEVQQKRKDGATFPVFLSTSAIKTKRGEPRYFINVANDISERQREAKALKVEKERLSTTLTSIDVAVITTDDSGKILIFNRAAEEITGWTSVEAIGKLYSEVYQKPMEKDNTPQVQKPVEYVLENGRACGSTTPTKIINRMGNTKQVTQNATPLKLENNDTVGALLTFRDVTLQQKMEEELQKSQKLESLGVLAGGIAHDFNNILTAILGNISMAKMHGKKAPEKTERFLQQAIKAAEQTRALTNQLLTFARGGNPIKENASIVDLIQESSDFVARGSGVRCKYNIDDRISVVAMDVGQISQVINNLIINAIQAMPKGGTIRIYVKNIAFSEDDSTRPNVLNPGDYVSIAIQDQGTGIPEDVLPKIFDPYFTTKEAGNGLGLASCYSIIRKHEGQIEVESTPNVGTTFTLYLPASQEQSIDAIEKEENTLVKGEAKILFMDDETYIRDIAGEMLTYLGFEVAFSANGDEAIKRYREAMDEGEQFDIVMLDITIPGGMGGKEAIKHLREINPNVKAIVASGYSKDPVMEKYQEYGFSGRILKPFGIKELNKAFKEIN